MSTLTSRLIHRVTLQQESSTSDGAGGVTRTWQNVVDLWAEIVPMSGRESVISQQLTGSVTHRITLRYRSGVHTAMRVLYGTRVFNIRSIRNLGERSHTLEMMVEEGSG